VVFVWFILVAVELQGRLSFTHLETSQIDDASLNQVRELKCENAPLKKKISLSYKKEKQADIGKYFRETITILGGNQTCISIYLCFCTNKIRIPQNKNKFILVL